MLVLSRAKDEVVHIGDNVTVTVVEIRGDKVRLGFKGPDTVKIHRGEIYAAIQLEQRRAEQQAAELRAKANV